MPLLTSGELQAVEAALREQLRSRKTGILYDDAYGLWTEEDQVSVAAEASALMDPKGTASIETVIKQWLGLGT